LATEWPFFVTRSRGSSTRLPTIVITVSFIAFSCLSPVSPAPAVGVQSVHAFHRLWWDEPDDLWMSQPDVHSQRENVAGVVYRRGPVAADET